jgi:nucleoside-diphosphate-sugar epimerase
MVVLVTGTSGFVGVNIVEALLRRSEDVVALAATPMPPAAERDFAAHPGRLRTTVVDVTNEAAVHAAFRAQAPELVVHGAAMTPGVRQERTEGARVIAVNVIGTRNVLEAAADGGVRRLVFLSSGAVYGAGAYGAAPLDEGATPLPESLYAITKHAAERLALRYRAIGNLEVAAARLSSVFGPWERETGVRETLSPPWQAMRLFRLGEAVRLPRPGRRDWIYAPDVAEAVLALLFMPKPPPDVVNVGPGAEWTIEEFCHRIGAKLEDGTPPNVDLYSDRDRAPLAIERLVREVGFRPRFGLDAAAAAYLDWLTEHAD